MSEMVERVAKAACEADDHYLTGRRVWEEMSDDSTMDMDGKNYWRVVARAAIEAMRAPTDAMIDRACGKWAGLYPAFPGEKPQPTAGEVVATTYRAMIDAALAPSTVVPGERK